MKTNRFLKISAIVFLLLFVFSWWYIFSVEGANLKEIVSEKNVAFFQDFIGRLLGSGTDQPAFLDGEAWSEALLRTYDTIKMSVIAVFMAMLAVLVALIPLFSNLINAGRTSVFSRILYRLVNFLFVITRSVPELLWAMILVFILQPGIFTGALALAINHFGILGKITYEQIENTDFKPFMSLRNAGGSSLQIFIYGLLPTVMPKFLGNVFYRWEEIIRSSVVVGFVGTGGLGQALQLSMSFRQFTTVSLYLICYIIAVYIIDYISSYAKRFVMIRT